MIPGQNGYVGQVVSQNRNVLGVGLGKLDPLTATFGVGISKTGIFKISTARTHIV